MNAVSSLSKLPARDCFELDKMSNTPFKQITPFKALTPALGDLSNQKLLRSAWKTPQPAGTPQETVHGLVHVFTDDCEDLVHAALGSAEWSGSGSEELQEVLVPVLSPVFSDSEAQALDLEIASYLQTETLSHIPSL